MPEINLVPMMDVIMTILTFFIILTMTMSNFQSVDIRLPGRGDGKSAGTNNTPTKPLIIGLDVRGQIRSREIGAIDRAQMTQQIQAYLQQNPEGVVVLNADKDVPYAQVVQLLSAMRDVGGGRVSLAIQ
ncbi:MAG: biopolymer transporter ExbD [Alkalinema sp. RU_4_3]|nr:biopolymer transporter ExbD [Alkalinema sp. RU_4_3]